MYLFPIWQWFIGLIYLREIGNVSTKFWFSLVYLHWLVAHFVAVGMFGLSDTLSVNDHGFTLWMVRLWLIGCHGYHLCLLRLAK